MSRKEEIQAMTAAIIEAYKGQAYFNFEEASRIVGCGRHSMAYKLNQAGVLVQKIGPSKRVSAYDLASAMVDGRISPIDNTSKVTA